MPFLENYSTLQDQSLPSFSCFQSMEMLYNYIGIFYIFLPLFLSSTHIQMDMNTVSKIILKPGVFTLSVGNLQTFSSPSN